MWGGIGPWPPWFPCLDTYVYMYSLCMYIRKRQFCEVEAMKIRDPLEEDVSACIL